MEPISPQPYDLAVRRADGSTKYVQVKTAFKRDEKRYGGEYLVVRGAKNNGDVYTKDEVDIFVAVWVGDVYLFPNSDVMEYRIRSELICEKWTTLEHGIS